MEQFIIFFISVLVVLSILNHMKKIKNITYVISPIDNRKYLVRKEKDSLDAANLLAELNKHIQNIINACQNTDKKNANLLIERYNPETLSETIPGSTNFVSYSLNKGQKIAICLRNLDNTFMKMNTILFVTIHELAHVMTVSTGHTREFWANMKFILEQAEKAGIYQPVNYNKYPEYYCGMEINSTPYDFK